MTEEHQVAAATAAVASDLINNHDGATKDIALITLTSVISAEPWVARIVCEIVDTMPTCCDQHVGANKLVTDLIRLGVTAREMAQEQGDRS